MQMTDTITSMADLDDLDLDLETDGVSEVTEAASLETVNEVADDDLVLDDLDTTTNQPAASNAQESDDLKLDESIDDLKLEDNITEAPVDKVNPELSKPKLNLDDEIELELDVNEGIKPSEKPTTTEVPTNNNEQTASVEAPKKTRKPRTPKAKEASNQAIASVDNGDVSIVKTGDFDVVKTGNGTSQMVPLNSSKYLDPSFPIEKLDRVKYETRATVRSNETIDELAEKIKLQGQKEPIHVYIDENEKAYLLAGFHRVKALEKNGMTHAETYVHKNISEAEIYKICTGTNEPRTQLTEWDKIVSVGKYTDSNPTVSVDDEKDTNSVVSVFGYSRSSVYNYIKIWDFYKNKSVLINHFNQNGASIPGYAYQILSRVIEECKHINLSDEAWVEILKETMTRGNRSTFAAEMVNVASEYLVKNNPINKLVPELEKDMNVDETRVVGNFVADEKDKLNQKNIETEVANLEAEIEVEKDSKQVVDSCYSTVILELTKCHSGLDSLLAIDKYHELRNVNEVKKIKELTCLIIEQVKKL